MESLDKLRELAADINSAEIIDHLDVAGKFVFHSEWLDSWHKAFNAACDEIESEIAERYMELPVDADGVPIRVGDNLEHTQGGWTFTADSLEIDRWGAHIRPNGQARIQCANCRHVKPRTVEDVLAEFFYESRNSYTSEKFDLVDKYSDEIRGLL